MYHVDNSIPQFIKEAIEEGYRKLDALWPINHTISFVANKGKSRHGYCRKIHDGFYQIAINRELVNKEDAIEVVMHELLHSYPDVWNYSVKHRQFHTGEWLKRAMVVNKTYGVKIQRTNSYKKTKSYVKFRFECSKCHHTWDYAKTPKWMATIQRAQCPFCKTRTIRQIDIKGVDACG